VWGCGSCYDLPDLNHAKASGCYHTTLRAEIHR
jgi:hypothetical protein